MSFMPGPDTIVKLQDGRVGRIAGINLAGRGVIEFPDGTRETITPWDIQEVVEESDE